MPAAADLRKAKADELREIAETLGDPAFAIAAAVLDGGDAAELRAGEKRPGRPKRDDTAALRMVAGLLENGFAKTVHQACEFAASITESPHNAPAARDRLRRKFSKITAGKRRQTAKNTSDKITPKSEKNRRPNYVRPRATRDPVASTQIDLP